MGRSTTDHGAIMSTATLNTSINVQVKIVRPMFDDLKCYEGREIDASYFVAYNDFFVKGYYLDRSCVELLSDIVTVAYPGRLKSVWPDEAAALSYISDLPEGRKWRMTRERTGEVVRCPQ